MRKPSPALIISCIALFVALGGTSYAVSKLPKNSVGSAQIKKNAVSSAKVKNGSLTAADFKKGQLMSGAQGPKGDAGAPGPTASAYAELYRDPAFPLPGTFTEMFSFTEFASSSTGPLKLNFKARVFVTASANLFSTAAGVTGSCQLVKEDAASTSFLGWTEGQTFDASGSSGKIAMHYAFEAEPGTWDITLQCRSSSAGNLSIESATLSAIAVAR